MKKIAALVVTFVMLSGCVSTKNIQINQQDLAKLNPNNVGLTKREKPDFSAMTAGKAAFALVGALAMIAAGNEIVEENNIEDPSGYIQAELAKALNETYGFTTNTSNSKTVTSTKASEISKNFAESDLVLDVQTINWSFGYFPTDWNNYRVIYSAKLRLFDTKAKTIVAEGFCSRVPEENETAPSYDQLLANNAERLKEELKIAANKCISEFKNNVLSIQS